MFLNFFIKNKNYLILLFTVVYVMAFAVNAYVNHNIEFIYYTILLIGLIYIIVLIHQHLRLGFFIIVNLSLLGFFHLLGGNYYIGTTRLYECYLIPGVIRYDNFVHSYGTLIATVALYTLIADFVDERVRKHFIIFAFGLVLMAIGLGTINELVEFFAVIFLNAAEQVGGYYNNTLDLLFNTVGSIFGCVVVYLYIERPRILKKINDKINKNN